MKSLWRTPADARPKCFKPVAGLSTCFRSRILCPCAEASELWLGKKLWSGSRATMEALEPLATATRKVRISQRFFCVQCPCRARELRSGVACLGHRENGACPNHFVTWLVVIRKIHQIQNTNIIPLETSTRRSYEQARHHHPLPLRFARQLLSCLSR
jgi:hypothetical protein